MQKDKVNEQTAPEQQARPAVPQRGTSNAWVYLALATGVCFGLGNTVFGQGCSKLGFWGGSFTGPTVLTLALLYRFIESCCIKRRRGTFVDWDNSNYWTIKETQNEEEKNESEGQAINDDFQAVRPDDNIQKGQFNWRNFWVVTASQSLPPVAGLFFVSYAFKFALQADMNQGCIPSLFAVVGIYIAIVFYFCFNEVISVSKIIGLILIILCIVFLAFDEKDEAVSELDYTAKEKQVFGGLAVLCGLTAPLFWTVKGYFLRKSIDAGHFTCTMDLAIDSQICQGVCLTLLFITYCATHDLDVTTFWQGQLVGVFFFIGGVISPMCYDTGPGGPINALVNTSIIYQTVLSAIVFGQTLSAFQILGICFGISASLMITLFDDILDRCRGKGKRIGKIDSEAPLLK